MWLRAAEKDVAVGVERLQDAIELIDMLLVDFELSLLLLLQRLNTLLQTDQALVNRLKVLVDQRGGWDLEENLFVRT
jgi:hypothetical protein